MYTRSGLSNKCGDNEHFRFGFRLCSRERKKTFPTAEEAMRLCLTHGRQCEGTESGCASEHQKGYPVVHVHLADMTVTER